MTALPLNPTPDTLRNPATPLSPQTLYESAVAFGIRKALQTEQGKSEMEGRITQLDSDVKDLERQVGRTAQHLREKCLGCIHADVAQGMQPRAPPPSRSRT